MRPLLVLLFFLVTSCATAPEEYRDCTVACLPQIGEKWGKCVARCGADPNAAPRSDYAKPPLSR